MGTVAPLGTGQERSGQWECEQQSGLGRRAGGGTRADAAPGALNSYSRVTRRDTSRSHRGAESKPPGGPEGRTGSLRRVEGPVDLGDDAQRGVDLGVHGRHHAHHHDEPAGGARGVHASDDAVLEGDAL